MLVFPLKCVYTGLHVVLSQGLRTTWWESTSDELLFHKSTLAHLWNSSQHMGSSAWVNGTQSVSLCRDDSHGKARGSENSHEVEIFYIFVALWESNFSQLSLYLMILSLRPLLINMLQYIHTCTHTHTHWYAIRVKDQKHSKEELCLLHVYNLNAWRGKFPAKT